MHVHLATTFSYDPHDTWMGYGTLDSQCLLVQLLQPLGIFLLRVHLDLKSIDFKQLSALLQVFCAVWILTCSAGLTHWLLVMHSSPLLHQRLCTALKLLYMAHVSLHVMAGSTYAQWRFLTSCKIRHAGSTVRQNSSGETQYHVYTTKQTCEAPSGSCACGQTPSA